MGLHVKRYKMLSLKERASILLGSSRGLQSSLLSRSRLTAIGRSSTEKLDFRNKSFYVFGFRVFL